MRAVVVGFAVICVTVAAAIMLQAEPADAQNEGYGSSANGIACCSKNGVEWWLNAESCRHEGGRIVAAAVCDGGQEAPSAYESPPAAPPSPPSTGETVCCLSNGAYTVETLRQCRRNQGQVADMASCQPAQNDAQLDRICCARGRRDWWSTPAACRNDGGSVVADFNCRAS